MPSLPSAIIAHYTLIFLLSLTVFGDSTLFLFVPPLLEFVAQEACYTQRGDAVADRVASAMCAVSIVSKACTAVIGGKRLAAPSRPYSRSSRTSHCGCLCCFLLFNARPSIVRRHWGPALFDPAQIGLCDRRGAVRWMSVASNIALAISVSSVQQASEACQGASTYTSTKKAVSPGVVSSIPIVLSILLLKE